MRIEHLFSKLESRTSSIFAKIRTAVSEGQDYVDILEKDIHTLFKFMNVSIRRSKKYRDDFSDPYRENDFIVQHILEAVKRRGQSGEPGQFWLEDLLYLLKTDHDEILADASKKKETGAADTYKHFSERYALQIWNAAPGYEFFLNERLVDFEGDMQSFLGAEVKETGHQLTWMTAEDLIYLVLPISPETAVVFCDESRCWESSFADMMHRLKEPYPQNSLLSKAPHKDVIEVNVPRQKRGKKRWPATVAWRISIGTLAREHHRIIAAYSLSHAQSVIIARSRARFEKARRDLEVFGKERMRWWRSVGFRGSFTTGNDHQQHRESTMPPTEHQVKRIVSHHMDALDRVMHIINNTQEELPRTKDNAFTFWLAIRAIQAYGDSIASLSGTNETSFPIMHPALKATFEAAYPPKHPEHRDLITINFWEFLNHAMGDKTFKKLSFEIDKRIGTLVPTDTFHSQFEKYKDSFQASTDALDRASKADDPDEEFKGQQDVLQHPSFRSIWRAAHGFDVLKWMFKERQDILATFVKQLAVPHKDFSPQIVRIRARRE